MRQSVETWSRVRTQQVSLKLNSVRQRAALVAVGGEPDGQDVRSNRGRVGELIAAKSSPRDAGPADSQSAVRDPL
jgi:hypothetical protein